MTVTAAATSAEWYRIQSALRREVTRVTDLLRSVREPDAHAVGQWTLAEVAVHLSQAWLVVPGLARRDLSRIYEVMPSLAGTAGDSLIRDLWELDTVTNLGVRSDTERDPAVLAARIEAAAEEFLAECADRSADEESPWLVEGSTVRLLNLAGHLLNETIMHGLDIAQAERRAWRIEPTHAAMVLSEFIVPVINALDPRVLVDSEQAAGFRARYNVQIRGWKNFHFIFDDGSVTIEEPSARRIDCHISADPVGFLMVIWGRRSQWSAIARGQLLTWGRKPWLGPQFRRLLRNP
ncbi:MAG TPA: maleylpyruvate isomerase N-terminal domain-containing protein [Pseudonocardiaceae bacterium]|nr:maleylpyruvate isomerase N-terminal domain-containing protein [Pseudonocardiaceae bacterium]